MRSSDAARLALLGALALSCASAHAPVAGTPASNPLARAFVEAHDRVRAAVPGAALPPLRWSPELAGDAAGVAARCRFEHGRRAHGESLNASLAAPVPEAVVRGWAAEAENFDPAGNRCAGGAVCTHYTQIVWRATRELGCASARCESGSPFGGGAWYLTACSYEPAGNLGGERPY